MVGAGVMRWTVRLEARTDGGEVETTELATITRPAMVGTLAEIGLVLAEAKGLLAGLQASMVRSQVAEHVASRRACSECGVCRALKDRRTRRLQTLFGTVEVEAPRFRACQCGLLVPPSKAAVSPVSDLLPARCTPELQRVQAELGARTSFRDAAGILEALLPVAPANHEGVRTRTHAVALRLEAADRQAAVAALPGQGAPEAAGPDASASVVMLDGAYVRSVPGHQVRRFEAVCGKVEHAGHDPRRFALVRSVAERPHALLRAALLDQGWRDGDVVTAISDGDPALPALVRSATKAPVQPILDWFHLSIRVRHVEQAFIGLRALEQAQQGPLDRVQADVDRLRHLLWNGHHGEASEVLDRIVSGAEDTAVVNGADVVSKVDRLVGHCTDLCTYIESNADALINYGQRHRAGEPISTSPAESTVNHLVNARMNKRRQMRWSPLGAHRVLQVRAAVIDGRFGLAQQALQLAV